VSEIVRSKKAGPLMSRHKDGIPLSVEPSEEDSKLLWVTRNLRNAVTSGRLRVGDRLPSHRDLASQWRVSRGVITAAYEQLQLEGVLRTQTGNGTFVAVGGALARVPAPPIDFIDLERSPIDSRIPFLAREADVSLFPIKVWQRHVGSALNQDPGKLLLDKSLMGIPSLRAQIASYLAFSRGFRCSPKDIMITTGARHSLDLVARALRHLTQDVWVEDPGYPQAQSIFKRSGLRTVSVRVDEEGLVVADGCRNGPKARLVFVTPAHQAPTGVALSLERRKALLAWAEEQDGYIVEDDYDGAFAFDTTRAPSLKASDVGDRVIHVGSFNKILFPALRLGYVVMPARIRSEMQSVKAISGWSTSALEQIALTSFIGEGQLSRHIRKAERIYAHRCKLALQSIEAAFGQKTRVTGTHAGFHFCLWLPNKETAVSLQENLPGIRLQPVRRWGLAGEQLDGFVIGFASLGDKAIKEAGSVLGSALRDVSI
jgi:GntR family transcriptional regulator / MocR family aminotransferase